jgi:hypothetical protein
VKKLFPEIKLIVIYDPIEGKAIADSVTSTEYAFILDALRNQQLPIIRTYGNETMIGKTRLLILHGVLKPEEMVYYWPPKDQIILINKYAALDSWPNGFCDYETSTCEKILMFAVNKRKEERKVGR